MVRPFPYPLTGSQNFQSIPITIGLISSIFALVALCAKHGFKSPSKRLDVEEDDELYEVKSNSSSSSKNNNNNFNKTPISKSPLASPRRLFTSISNLTGNKKNKEESDAMVEDHKDVFGEGGLWQKNILMGEKCQPPEFSGVIYYDNYGNRISEMPRSPRASAVAGLNTSFSFPVPSHGHHSS